jgi:hypothetical protein
VGTEHGANIITGIMTTFGGKNFGEQLKIFIRFANKYYITEFKHSKNSIFRNTADTNIKKCQIYIPGLYSSAVGIKDCFLPIKFRNKRCPVNV